MNNYPEIKQVGQRIKAIREKEGKTQMDLAATIKSEPSYISVIENGRTNPSLETLIDIARALEVELSAFFIDE